MQSEDLRRSFCLAIAERGLGRLLVSLFKIVQYMSSGAGNNVRFLCYSDE